MNTWKSARLNSLTLHNIRRFGEDVKIEFSPEANIILAPNGTGKTAVFEGIEFALTGRVARLGKDIRSLVRESANLGKASLSFDDGDCSAEINHSGIVSTNSNLISVFNQTDHADFPYLLRLTHLLDQREQDWFVQAGTQEAGTRLARLPVGRDGSRASTALAQVRRQLTEQNKQIQLRLAELFSLQAEWQHLISSRDSAASMTPLSLRSRDQLIDALTRIAESANASEFSPEPSAGLDSISASHTGLTKLIQSRRESTNSRYARLMAMEGSFENFLADRNRLKDVERTTVALRDSLQEKRRSNEGTSLAINQLQARLHEIRSRHADIRAQMENISLAILAKADLDAASDELTRIQRIVTDLERKSGDSHARWRNFEQVASTHHRIAKQLQANIQVSSDLHESLQLADRWALLILEDDQVGTAIAKAQERIATSGEAFQAALGARGFSTIRETEARNRLLSFSRAADAIRDAVAVIAANLPENSGDCPVCGVAHGPVELRSRIAVSLDAIDPALATAEREESAAIDQSKSDEELLDAAKLALRQARADLATHDERRLRIRTEIDEIRRNQFITEETPNAAAEVIREGLRRNEATKTSIQDERASLSPYDPDASQQAKIESDIDQQVLEAARKSRVDANAKFEKSSAAYGTLASNSSPVDAIPLLSADIAANEQQITQILAKMKIEMETGAKHAAEIGELESTIVDQELQISSIRARMSDIQTSWRELGLTGEPLPDVAVGHRDRLLDEVLFLEGTLAEASALSPEISALKNADRSDLFQNEIDRKREQHSETEYGNALNERIAASQRDASALSDLSAAMESLSNLLSAQITNIHDHVVAIVPRWQALLRRIVRDPRFTQTSLDFYSHYRKEHASISVPLHGGEVPAPSVASEAQMTDLQLTFLLAMALGHNWSNWRGLLLDDPTQHHDLVHASAVFDVLRDYIVDHKFQVVIATHDALQARFFMRKLENDGIDVNLWTLIPTSKGVVARRGR